MQGRGLMRIWFRYGFGSKPVLVGHVFIQGFEWSDSYQACVDVDECSAASAVCGDNKVCVYHGAYCAQPQWGPHDALSPLTLFHKV